jgi:hypothetical protein
VTFNKTYFSSKITASKKLIASKKFGINLAEHKPYTSSIGGQSNVDDSNLNEQLFNKSRGGQYRQI